MLETACLYLKHFRLRCVIENDENLNNMGIRYALDFAKLVELATKIYFCKY